MPERSYDFNRLGEGLEQRGLVRRGAVGNAIARLFRARDLERTAREMFAANPELFFIVDGQVTPLQYGTTWPIPEGPQRRRRALRRRSSGGAPAAGPVAVGTPSRRGIRTS